MRKRTSVLRAPMFFILLTIFVGVMISANAQSKKRQSSSKKGKVAAGKNSGTRSATTSKSAKRGRAGKSNRSSLRACNRSRASANESKISAQAQSLSRKRVRLTRSERRLMSQFRESRRRRARAVYLARLRALRARDDALRNIAWSNIENDNSEGEDP